MTQTKKKGKIKAILFDLGRVLVDFDFTPAFERLARTCRLSPREIEEYFLESGIEVLYDGGKIGSREFYRQIKEGIGHGQDYRVFKRTWNEIFTPIVPMVKLLESLKGRYLLALISNTNPMHFVYLWKKYPFMKRLDRIVLSYEEKIRKPDERIYRKAARLCRAAPHEIFYIDDRPDLTEAAGELGFVTFTYRKNHEELLRQLKMHRVI
jgi:glucose-1-phosphatase